MVLEWRPVFPLAEMLSAGGSQKPQGRPFAKKSLQVSVLKPITGYWQAISQYQIRRTLKMTRKCSQRQSNGNCTKWPRSTTFWRCSRAARTYVLRRRSRALKTSRWQLLDTFQTWKRSSKPPGHSFNMMVRLHSNCQTDHLCHQLCPQRTTLEDELKSSVSAESEESNVIQSKGTRIAHLIVSRITKIG